MLLGQTFKNISAEEDFKPDTNIYFVKNIMIKNEELLQIQKHNEEKKNFIINMIKEESEFLRVNKMKIQIEWKRIMRELKQENLHKEIHLIQ